MTATYKKALLASAILLALSGADVFAEAPQMTGSQSGMSQSSMIDVKSGKEAGKTGEISDQTEKAEPSMEVKESHQTVAVGDASLYLSADDDAAIEAHTGKTIAHVDFDGIPEEVKTKLSPLLQSKPGSTITAEGIRNDVASLGSTGVFSQIRPKFKEIPEGVDLTYGLVTNPIVRDVEFTGNTIFTSDYLKSILQVPEGSVLNFVLVNQKLKEIEDAYLKQGYMLVSIPNVEVTPKGILKVHISEGVIEDIQLVGNDKTKDKVILRELKMKKGKPFNKFQASRSMERLYNLGYFEDVNMKLLPGKENEHNVVIEIDVVEQKTGVITVGAGYSDSDGTVGIIELVIRTSAAQAIKSISTGNSAAPATVRTIPSPTPARGSIPTVTPSGLPSSTASMNTMTMIRTVIPSQNTIREEVAGTSPGDVRMANIARTTLHLKVRRKNTMTMTVSNGAAQQLTALRIIRRKVIIARMK